MGEKGKILKFVKKERETSNDMVNGGVIVNLLDKRKIKAKNELTNDLLDSISYMLWLLGEIYNDMYDIKDDDFIIVTKQIHEAILELEKCYDRMKDINI